MAGGFGFARYPQRPTPGSQEVGMALMQRGQGQEQAAPAQPAPMGPPADGGAAADQALRLDGAHRMGGSGQIDDNASDDDGVHSANAVNVAIGEAMTRAGGGYTTSKNPFKPRDRTLVNLQQLGLSETEAMLLIQTGGA